MRPIRSLLLFVLVVFVGGALLAPWMYWSVQALAAHLPAGSIHAFADSLARSPLHRFVNRSLLILALLGIRPLARSLGAGSFREIGLVRPAGQWPRLFGGFLLGFGSLACLAAVILALHGRALRHDLTGGEIARMALGAGLTAGVVSVIEEILFRGAIFGALRREWDWRFALLLSSMVYAIVHFLKSADPTGPVTWTTGLQILPLMLQGFTAWDSVIPGFLNLTLAGLLLGLAYQRTGNLWFSIGLHAGWIFWLRFYGLFTAATAGSAVWLCGSAKLIDGWLALIILLLALAVLIRLLPAAKSGRTAPMSAAAAKKWLDAGLGFLYPEVCQICDGQRATVPEGFVCVECWQRVRFIKPPFCNRCGLPYEGEITAAFECGNCRELNLHFRTARSAVNAVDPVLDIIHRYKYRHALWFEPFLADLLIRQAAPELARERCALIVPVPLHPAKQREREFNQAERLAGHLGRAAKIPVNANLLRRVQPTQTQTRLSRQERAKNVQGAFALKRGVRLHGERVVIVDDVFTTGATTSACARMLRQAGAGDVCVWTVARGL